MKRYIKATYFDDCGDPEINRICTEIENSYPLDIYISAFDSNDPHNVEFEVQDEKDGQELFFCINLTYDKVKKLGVDGVIARINKRVDSILSRRNKWPSKNVWNSCDNDWEFEELWSKWLSKPEDAINKQLQIFPEPSTQGGWGTMFIFDKSGQERDENGFPWKQDFGEWCDWQYRAAANSRNAEEYKQKYREHIRKLCGI